MREILMNYGFILYGVFTVLFMGYCTKELMKNNIKELGGNYVCKKYY